jgi:hypothetical protein
MPTAQKQALNVRVGQQVRGFYAEELESEVTPINSDPD